MSSRPLLVQLVCRSVPGDELSSTAVTRQLTRELDAEWLAVEVLQAGERGPSAALRACGRAGAARLVSIESELVLDYLGQARLIASYLQSLSDIIGILVEDRGGRSLCEGIGQALAEYLELPHYGGVRELHVVDEAYRIRRRAGDVEETRRLHEAAVFCTLPSLEAPSAAIVSEGKEPPHRSIAGAALGEASLGLVDRLPLAEHARPQPNPHPVELHSSAAALLEELRRNQLWGN